MRVYIPDMDEFFVWMDTSGLRYVVLRGFSGFDKGYPKPGKKEDVDLLVDNTAMPLIREKYSIYKRRQGSKCDIYSVTGPEYLNLPYYPKTLAEQVLTDRRKWKDKFYIPSAKAHFLSLLYHIAYQKAEISKIHFDDPSQSIESKYIAELELLQKELKTNVLYTLTAFHEYLKKEGHSIPQAHLVATLQNDFKHHRKSYFLAKVMDEYPGEMNLFVIRKVAMQQNKQDAILKKLAEHYTIVAVKDIPFWTRWRERKNIRGGKWKRGGLPHIAVVVFDSDPQPITEESKKVHPFVFNGRQFFKPALRQWFAEETGLPIKKNPLHSTDNEAEAVGHFNLFFTPEEQLTIFSKVFALRAEITVRDKVA